ncbi:MAG: N-acetylmuramoyl-L-alanine amidase [Firmicutes bacterium]|nr:N-acetylmuramoyl-L-alanine amidase [Bacillota bacterium]
MKRLALLLKRGGVLTALALMCLLDAHASVTVYAVWYPNGYNSPPQVVQNGATIGGWFYLRLRVQPQSGYIISASVTQSALAEQTDVHPVTPTSPTFQSTQPNPAYGDPTGNVVVLQSQQNLADRHNGQYRLDVTVQYTVSTGNPPPNDRQTFTEVASFTFNVLNLLLVDSRPEPYFVWKPDEMTGVPFSAQLQHAQAGTCTVKLEIFRTEDNQNPIFVRQFDGVSRPGTWSWTWDGKLADGVIAPRGVYTYRLSALAYVPTLPDSDSNRSDSLRMTQTRLEVSEDRRLLFRYYLSEAGSDGSVLALDPSPQEVIMWDVGVATNAGWNSLEVILPPMEESPPGSIRYLALIPDRGHINGMDKAHRMRWALPLNSRVPLVGVVVDAGHSGRASGPGAVGQYGVPSKVVYECDVNFVLANLLGAELVSNHLTYTDCWQFGNLFAYTVAYTRSSREDPAVNNTKKGRRERVKRIAQAVERGFSSLVSIHHNSSPGTTQRRDVEVYYAPKNVHGSVLAQPVCDWLRVALRPELRPAADNPKRANFFFLHWHSIEVTGSGKKRRIGHQVPAVLVEAGWMNNPVDLQEIDPDNPQGRERRLQTVLGIHLGTDEFYGR